MTNPDYPQQTNLGKHQFPSLEHFFPSGPQSRGPDGLGESVRVWCMLQEAKAIIRRKMHHLHPQVLGEHNKLTSANTSSPPSNISFLLDRSLVDRMAPNQRNVKALFRLLFVGLRLECVLARFADVR
jgi:hypothetical protein